MIVATLLEPRLAAIADAIAACDATADAFEVRLDALEETVEPAAIRALTRKPLIATARRMRDGGRRELEPTQRRLLLQQCLDGGFDFADLELDEPPHPEPARTIRSYHELRGPTSSAGLQRLVADVPTESVVKFAGAVRSLSDTLHLLAAARALQQSGRRFAVMGLGEFPRALTHLLGAHLLYGGGRTNAPGQPGHKEIRDTLSHWGDPKAARELMLVVGDPVAHSLSPRMHNAALAAAGVDAAYGALRVSHPTELQILLDRAASLGLVGLSVTTPLKDAAYELCAERTPEAEAARAVNCVQIEDGVAVGHNTDGEAAAAITRRLVNDDGRILVIGTGGAARAFIARWNAGQLTVAGRTPETLRQIAKQFGCRTIPLGLAAQEAHDHDLLINASRQQEPVALDGYAGALFDFHYGAAPTAWERYARAHDAHLASGRELLLEQGVRAFKVWTGKEPDRARMSAALEVPR